MNTNGHARQTPALTQFRRGQSGNPAGRPRGAPNKATAEIRELLAPLDQEGIARLTAIIQDRMLYRRRPDIVLRALELARAYRHGRPRQQVEMTGTGIGAPQFDFLTVLTAAEGVAKSWLETGQLPPRRVEKYRAAAAQAGMNSMGTTEGDTLSTASAPR